MSMRYQPSLVVGVHCRKLQGPATLVGGFADAVSVAVDSVAENGRLNDGM
jgi:hypothetical protein